jgi:hypothetical protein
MEFGSDNYAPVPDAREVNVTEYEIMDVNKAHTRQSYENAIALAQKQASKVGGTVTVTALRSDGSSVDVAEYFGDEGEVTTEFCKSEDEVWNS